MGTISSSSPALDADGNPATRRIVLAYRRDTGELIGRGMTSDGVGDPHWANVQFLLMTRGYNNSTAFLDYSPTKKAITFAGDAKITTAKAFGENASIIFDGANDYLNITDASIAIGTGDFSLDGFIRRTGNTDSSVNNDIILWDMRAAGATSDPLVYIDGNDASNNLVYFAASDRITGSPVVNNTDYHIELSRVSGVTRLFLNGVQQGSSYTDSTNYVSTQIRLGGRYASLSSNFRSYNGYHGCFRYTKGAGRHSANFTPPSYFVACNDSLGAGHYTIDTGSYNGECTVVMLDDFGGTTQIDLAIRTTPV